MPASLRDVARLAGVSVATASRALNSMSGRTVSGEKQALIQAAAHELNYQPASIARALVAARRTNSIGIVQRAIYRFTDPFWSPVLEGMTDEVLRHGYHIRCSFTVDDLSHDRRSRLLSSRFVDGLILIGDMGLASVIADLAPPKHIVVITGYDATQWESDLRYDVITMEKRVAMDTVVGHLVANGRRRLAYLGPPPNRDRRTEGYIQALARYDLPLNPGQLVDCDFGTEAGYTAALALLSNRAQVVDGLVCACDTIAIGAMRAAKELGLRLPVDLAITGFDNIPFSRDLDPPLTTVNVPKELMGELAARRVIERIAHPDRPPIIQMVPTTLVPRASCGEPQTT